MNLKYKTNQFFHSAVGTFFLSLLSCTQKAHATNFRGTGSGFFFSIRWAREKKVCQCFFLDHKQRRLFYVPFARASLDLNTNCVPPYPGAREDESRAIFDLPT